MSTKAEDTQKNILDTARKHFLKDGLTGASLRNIVKDAGLTTGAFYKYYPTKEALFDALTDPYMEHIYQIYDQIVEEFEKLSASDQTRNMSDTSSDGMEQMVDYIYDHYDNFRLLLKCGDSGKFELFIHNMVEREMKSSLNYMEKMKEYHGLYHVLGGTISIMDGKTMDDLNIMSLFDRITPDTKEVIIATNATREGETTALFLAKLLDKKGVNTTRIAHGLPIGSSLDYADELTLLKSFEGRKKV